MEKIRRQGPPWHGRCLRHPSTECGCNNRPVRNFRYPHLDFQLIFPLLSAGSGLGVQQGFHRPVCRQSETSVRSTQPGPWVHAAHFIADPGNRLLL